MSMKLFNFLREDTRLFNFLNCIYKIKVLYCDEKTVLRKTTNITQKDASGELENVVRAVLYVLERKGDLKKIVTEHFIVTVKIKSWKASQKIGFRKNGKVIKSYPFMIVLNVKLKSKGQNTNLQPSCTPLNSNNNALENLKNEALKSNVRVVLRKLNLPLDKKRGNLAYSIGRQNLEAEDNQTPVEFNAPKAAAPVELTEIYLEEEPVEKRPRKKKSQRPRSRSASPVEDDANRNNNVPLSNKNSSDTDTRRKRKLIAVHDVNEGLHLSSYRHCSREKALGNRKQDLGALSNPITSPEKKVTQSTYRETDRHFIEREELAEDMKLQQLAKSPPSQNQRRISSGIWNIVENIISPVKNIFSKS